MRRRRQRRAADIDITPLIDVLFMLIIFFVLTASFSQGHILVELPHGGGMAVENRAITLTIEKSGGLLWDGREISLDELAGLARETKGEEIDIAGDRETSYGNVAGILEILRMEGIGAAGLLLQEGAAADGLRQ